jgi:cytochrome d ubiquinol oxidase subunit II
MGPSGLAAVIAGWVTTEVGRQPFTVYGLLRTAQSRSPIAAPAAVSAATPFLAYDYWRRWFAMPGVLLTAQVPLLVIIAAAVFFWSLRRQAERLPFLMALALFLLGFAGLGVSIYPYLVPRAITIWDAAAPPQSLLFMLVGAVIIIPAILVYTSWAYWVFRGKAGAEGYH